MVSNAGNAPIRAHYIYGLVDPRTDAVRYIGRTCDPARRLAQHCEGRSLTDKGAWIHELRARHMRPRMCILETIDPDTEQLAQIAASGGYTFNGGPSPREQALDDIVSAREDYWIARYQAQGWALLN